MPSIADQIDWDRLWEKKAEAFTYDQIAGLIDARTTGMAAGVLITDKTALQVSTVLACVKAISDGCATPELRVFRDDPETGRRTKALKRPEYRLLNRRPNEWQTSFDWRRTMTMHAALTGDGLSIKVRDDRGRVRELIPIQPGQWDVRRVARYEQRYRCWDEFGMIGDFASDDVFHLPGVQWDYLRSMNAVSLARSAIGLSIASEKSQQDFHENGVQPSGIFSVTGQLGTEQYERITKYIKEKNKGEVFVLDRDGKFQSMAMTGVDAQHIETRRLQIEEICRGFGVFPIMVGHSDKAATFASSEAFFSAHLKHTLAPWHTCWTQRIDEMLLDGDGPLYAEFDTRYLREGSTADRAQLLRAEIETGVTTRNEWRDDSGRDPLDGLDEPLMPMNMQTQNGGKNEPTAPA
jgi:HK97 family phage portal protein